MARARWDWGRDRQRIIRRMNDTDARPVPPIGQYLFSGTITGDDEDGTARLTWDGGTQEMLDDLLQSNVGFPLGVQLHLTLDACPVLFVGEMNPYGSDPSYALYDAPTKASGYRLRTMVLGVSRETYLDPCVIARVNLCEGEWDRSRAKHRAAELLTCARDYSAIVLLGKKVRDAFGLRSGSLVLYRVAGVPFVHLPHPSGLSRSWDDPATVEKARSLLREVTSLPIGELDE